MRLPQIFIVGLLGACSAGCGEEYFGNALRNFVVAPYRATDERVLECRSKQWAEDAWRRLCLDDNAAHHSADFEEGFRRGFVDYITRGGNGNAPATPPIRYQEFGVKTAPGERSLTRRRIGLTASAARAAEAMSTGSARGGDYSARLAAHQRRREPADAGRE